MFSLIASVWFLKQLNVYFFTGLVGFAAACFFSIYVLSLFMVFLREPGTINYTKFCLGLVLLFLLHVLGPLPLVPALIFYTITWQPLSFRWRTALLLTPAIVLMLNAFWLLPYFLDWEMLNPAWAWLPALQNLDRHLTYDNWSEFSSKFSRPLWLGPQIVGISLALYGFTVMRRFVERPVVVGLALVASFALFLSYFGSFVPLFSRIQPVRFVLPALVAVSIPVGVAASILIKQMRLPVGLSIATAAMALFIPAIGLGWLKQLPLPPSPDPFAEFVARQTTPGDRLLIQSPDGYQAGGFETKIFPLRYKREVIGSNFSAVHDPAQFLDKVLLGRELKDWPKNELRTALDRWGVSWVFTVNSEGHALLSNTLGDSIAKVGNYHAFRVSNAPTRFLVGDGLIEAKVNRIELKKLRPQNGLVVIRYSYNPSWRATPHMPVYSYPIAEDPSGFIALKDPPESVTLWFDPLALMGKRWPKKLNTIEPVVAAQERISTIIGQSSRAN
jgi:hypothetical protein